MRLFHYHLVTSKVREVEARYIGKLGFSLVARHGRIDEDTTSFESGHGWEELDQLGFKLRLSELERGAVNVVVQPGQWELPRLDHLGFALDEDDFVATLARAELRELRIQEHGGRRTFISTNAGYRLELHPPREWLDDFLEGQSELTLAELQLRADDPELKASVLGELLEAPYTADSVTIGEHARALPAGRPARPSTAPRRVVRLSRRRCRHCPKVRIDATFVPGHSRSHDTTCVAHLSDCGGRGDRARAAVERSCGLVLAELLGLRDARPGNVDRQRLLVLQRSVQRLGLLVPERRFKDVLPGV